MNRLLDLKQKRAALYDKADAVLKRAESENRPLTEAETTEIAGYRGEMDTLKRSIETEEGMATMRAEMSGHRIEVHDNREDAPFKTGGDYFQAVIRSMTPGNSVDPRLRPLAAATGLNEGVGEQGGFLVGQDMAADIWKRTYETGQILSRVRRIPIGANANGTKQAYIKESSRVSGSRQGGVTVYRKAEAGTVTATKPKLGEWKSELETGMALVYLTDEVIADAAQIDNLVRQVVPEEIAVFTEDEIFNGNGAGKPLGVLNASALISVAKETGQLAQTIVPANITKMRARLWARSRANSVWFINQDVEPQLHLMSLPVGTGGIPVYLPASGLSGSPYDTLYARPVIPIEHCATLGTVGDIVLADLSQYGLIEKGGVNVASSIHVQFIYGEQVLRFTWRNNGQPLGAWMDGALTPAKGSNTQSPFVALATRS